MNPNDILKEKKDLSLIDRLAFTNKNRKLMGMFGLGAELYVKPRELAKLRLDMLNMQELYYKKFQGRIDRMLRCHPDADGTTEKVSENPFPSLLEDLKHWPEKELSGFDNMLYQAYEHPSFPVDADTVTPIFSQFLVPPLHESDMSFCDCYLPLTNPDKTHNALWLRDTLLQWCKILKPAHGAAGFCVFVEPNQRTGQKYAVPFLFRYPGLDIHVPISFTLEVKTQYKRIKCVNWLTVLDDDIVAELGGLDVAREALSPECTIHPYDGGIVVQAGDFPQLGDTKGDMECLNPYRKVARFTRPVRYGPYSSALFRTFPPLVSKEEADKWVARFD